MSDNIEDRPDQVVPCAATNEDRAEAASAAFQDQYADELAAGRQAAKEYGWGPLDGTPAQRRWATSIRADQLEKLKAHQDAYTAGSLICSSKFWIERRYRSAEVLATELTVQAKEPFSEVGAILFNGAVKAASKARKQRKPSEDKSLEYLLTFIDQFVEVPAVKEVGAKYGQLVAEDKLYRCYAEDTVPNTLRLIVGSADNHGPKVNYLLEVTADMRKKLPKCWQP